MGDVNAEEIAPIKTTRAVLILLAISVVAQAVLAAKILNWQLGSISVTSLSASYTGAVIGLFLLGLIILLPWRLVQRRRGNYTNAPVRTAVVVMLIVVALRWISDTGIKSMTG